MKEKKLLGPRTRALTGERVTSIKKVTHYRFISAGYFVNYSLVRARGKEMTLASQQEH